MSERIAAALCLAAFFATASPVQDWMNTAWSALTAAAEEPTSTPIDPGKGDEGWLIDPNG